jgi:hypothetical protein
MQQMEHDDMSTESSEDRRTEEARKKRRTSHPSPPSPGPVSPPLLNDGLEAVRDSHC